VVERDRLAVHDTRVDMRSQYATKRPGPRS
jgi:hypothetical protein